MTHTSNHFKKKKSFRLHRSSRVWCVILTFLYLHLIQCIIAQGEICIIHFGYVWHVSTHLNRLSQFIFCCLLCGTEIKQKWVEHRFRFMYFSRWEENIISRAFQSWEEGTYFTHHRKWKYPLWFHEFLAVIWLYQWRDSSGLFYHELWHRKWNVNKFSTKEDPVQSWRTPLTCRMKY